MAEYSRTEILNELSRLLRARTSPQQDGGVLSPLVIHAQIIEIAKTVFLMNPGAIFYLAFLVRNLMLNLVRREFAVVEDMLVAVDNLSRPQDGGPIGNVGPSELNNAATALLALDAAGSVQGRPELRRFSRIIDRFTNLLRPNVSDIGGTFRLPSGEARDNIRANLVTLKSLHASMLIVLENLRFLVENYVALDVPTQVSQTALINIRTELLELRDTIEQSSASQNDTNSRLYLLRGLAGKVVAELLDQFLVPTFGPVLTSDGTGSGVAGIVGTPGTDDGSGPPFLAQAAGEATPGEVLSAPGPWFLDTLSQGNLDLKIDGGAATESIDISIIQGPGLHGRNQAPFTSTQLNPLPTWPGPPPFGSGSPGVDDPPAPPLEDYLPKQDLHLFVDSNSYDLKSQAWGVALENSIDVFRDVLNAPGGGVPTFEAGSDMSVVVDGEAVSAQFPEFARLDLTDLRSDYYNTVRAQPPVKLGFKHLGTLVFFSLPQAEESPLATPADRFSPGSGFAGWNIDGQNSLEDANELEDVEDRRYTHIFSPRVIVELAHLKDVTLTHVSGNTYTAPSGTFETHYAGFYVRGVDDFTAERYEIAQVVSDTEAVIDTRDDAPGSAAGAVHIFGSRGDLTQFTFVPDLLADTDKVADTVTEAGLTEDEIGDHGPRGPFNIPDTVEITVGPTVKTTRLPEGSGGTIASAVAALADEANGVHETNKYAHASFHCIFKEQAGFNNKITVQGRSRLLPEELGISLQFFLARPDLQTTPASGGGFKEFPGPFPLKTLEASAHEVFGYDVAQKVDPELDPFLSVEELEAVVGDHFTANGVEADVEIIETDVFGGIINLNAETATMTDPFADFVALGIGLGYLIELTEGDNSGIYFILLATTTVLTVQLIPGLNSRGFVGNETGVGYRIFTRQLKITSQNTGLSSSVEIVSQPTQFAFPTGVQFGTSPAIEAVNDAGDNLDLSGLIAGDNASGIGTVASVSSDGAQATIANGVSTGLLGLRFTFNSVVEQALETMLTKLGTTATSRNLLRKHNFDLNLDRLDAAISPLLTPGAALQSNVNTVKTLLADLLSVLTQSPLRTSEYTATIPVASLALEETLTPYSASRIRALDALMDSLNEHRFDRALQLLVTGDIEEFLNTTAETASFGGQLLDSARVSKNDLPTQSALLGRVEEEETFLTNLVISVDPDQNFDDAEEGVDLT